MRIALAAVGVVSIACLSACDPLHLAIQPLRPNTALVTRADTRVIETMPTNLDPLGKNHPGQISCAEPSPDIALAVSNAFGAGANVTVNFAGAAPSPDQAAKIAAAVSSSRVEAVAQLGERLASIQLLRDGLFRACEAFQNGALSPTSYALVLSRYGDTMVTMLGSELIAGEFGRTGAAISGKASGAATASDAQETADAAKAAQAKVATAQDTLSQKIAAEDKARSTLANATGDTVAQAKQTLDSATADTDQARRDLQTAQQEAAAAKTAAAQSAAEASGQGIGGLQRTESPETAHAIAKLVRGYISTPTVHSIMTACISVLEDNRRADTNLGAFCVQSMPLFVASLKVGYENSIKGEAETQADNDFRHAAARFKRLQAEIAKLKTALDPKPAAVPASAQHP